MNLIERICGLGGTVIPDAVWDCEALTPTDVKLYKILLDYGKLVFKLKDGKKTSDGFPIITVAQKTLAEKVRVSEKTIQTCLKRLKEVKLIKIKNHNGYKRNNHIILIGDFFGITSEQPEEKRRLQVVKKEIRRVPIKRVPIKISPTYKYMQKLRDLGGFTYSEKVILGIAKHYNMLASQFNHLTGYRSLPKNEPQKHKNWKHFEKLYNLTKDKGWDANLYLDAQFERAKKYWKNSKFKYPLPNMLCSEKAQKFFEKYLEERKEKYAMDLRVKADKGQKTVTVKQKVIQDIVRTVEWLSMYIRGTDAKERAEEKALRIFDAWESYAPSYLWTIGWFRPFIKELSEAQPDNEKIKEILAEFDMIDHSKSLQRVILKTVEMAEREFNIPENINIESA